MLDFLWREKRSDHTPIWLLANGARDLRIRLFQAKSTGQGIKVTLVNL
jgi:hypothetical protein